jgi:hypothetical protein
MLRPLFTPGKDQLPIVQEAGWAPRPVCTSADKSRPPLGFDPHIVQPVASRYTDLHGPPILIVFSEHFLIQYEAVGLYNGNTTFP